MINKSEFNYCKDMRNVFLAMMITKGKFNYCEDLHNIFYYNH